jgi:hypothetical protein
MVLVQVPVLLVSVAYWQIRFGSNDRFILNIFSVSTGSSTSYCSNHVSSRMYNLE